MSRTAAWALSGVVYLLLVIGGYLLYEAVATPGEAPHQQQENHSLNQPAVPAAE
ncbi:hypothetical protein [Brevibacillus aydinogluensis]|uniref:Uncharacterized protein n=1 Tax=Brevibacillus aydinogluensis TaxID=927786 RepID=A0AA48RJA3_9BACL|nr:hypothetical protein [Brevibacillus aydinogluensis]CAJ1004406.1 hypothetical protein BSPP4475_19110 [Brevibacillus aydinogluensis]